MITNIFMDIRDLLVARYDLKSSIHMNTYETLAISLFIYAGNESNRKSKICFNHSSETINRKFSEVLDCLMEMVKDFIVSKGANFCTTHKKIRDDKRMYRILKFALSLFMDTRYSGSEL
jgi:hypothetical protein